jgi:hypothetical protein
MAEKKSKKAAASAKPRTISKVVATSPGCAPLREAYARALELKPKTWAEVQDVFLRAMETFDDNVASGLATMGELQNGKGDFFNNLLAFILENCAMVELVTRGDVPGLIFPKHKLDATYPSTGPIEFMLEAKAVGTPRHPGSQQAKPAGRAGSADLDKRIKEIGFKAIDLKAEYARILTAQGEKQTVISGDLTTWLKSVKPRSYVFIAARVINDNDRDRVIRFANVALQVSDAVGLFCFRRESEAAPTRYWADDVPSHIEMGRVLFRACQDLTSIKNRAAT